MEFGHLSRAQATSQKLTLSLLHLPNELLLLIFEHLGEDELYSLSLLSRRLHHAALPICLVRCGLWKSNLSQEKLVLFADQVLTPKQKRGLLRLRISLDITSLKCITCDFHFPGNTLLAEVRFLRRLMEKLRSVEEVTLDFDNSLQWGSDDSKDEMMRYWDKWCRDFTALLNTVASKSSNLTMRQRHPLAQTFQRIYPIHSIQPSSSRHKMSIISRPVTTIQKIVGMVVGKPLLSRLLRGEFTNCPDTGDGRSGSPTPTLNTLTIGSSMLFHPSFLLWTIETLNNSPINTLSFDSINLASNKWSDILPVITLPVLSVLSINSCDIALSDLSAFLSRHPNITTLTVGASSVDLDLSIQPNLSEPLPQLTTLSAPTNYIVHFLTSAHTFPKLCLTITVSHIISASDFAAIEKAIASVSTHQVTIALSLELHVHSDWLDMDAELGVDGDNTLAQHVASLVIKTGWRGLENRDKHRLPHWLAHFCALEKLTFVDQSRWPVNARVKLTLIRSIGAACPGVKTVVFNDEARDIGTWLAM